MAFLPLCQFAPLLIRPLTLDYLPPLNKGIDLGVRNAVIRPRPTCRFCAANTYALNLCHVNRISLGTVNVIDCMILLYRLRL